MNDEYKEEILALERQLAELDLSDQSEIKDTLRHELLQRIATEGRETAENNLFLRRWDMFRKPLPAMALGILLGVTILAFAHPDTRASIANIVKSFRVGDNTYINQSGTVGEAEIDAYLSEVDEKLEQGKTYMLHNEYGTWGGAVPEGEEPVVRQLSSLSITARLVNHSLQVPTYYNEGIPARYRFSEAWIMPDGGTIIVFGIGRWQTMLMQTPVGDGRSFGTGGAIITSDTDGARVINGIEPKIEEIEIGDKKVVWQKYDIGNRGIRDWWAERYPDKVIGSFIWEHDGMCYILRGRLLTKEEGLKIIESLRPLKVNN